MKPVVKCVDHGIPLECGVCAAEKREAEILLTIIAWAAALGLLAIFGIIAYFVITYR